MLPQRLRKRIGDLTLSEAKAALEGEIVDLCKKLSDGRLNQIYPITEAARELTEVENLMLAEQTAKDLPGALKKANDVSPDEF